MLVRASPPARGWRHRAARLIRPFPAGKAAAEQRCGPSRRAAHWLPHRRRGSLHRSRRHRCRRDRQRPARPSTQRNAARSRAINAHVRHSPGVSLDRPPRLVRIKFAGHFLFRKDDQTDRWRELAVQSANLSPGSSGRLGHDARGAQQCGRQKNRQATICACDANHQ